MGSWSFTQEEVEIEDALLLDIKPLKQGETYTLRFESEVQNNAYMLFVGSYSERIVESWAVAGEVQEHQAAMGFQYRVIEWWIFPLFLLCLILVFLPFTKKHRVETGFQTVLFVLSPAVVLYLSEHLYEPRFGTFDARFLLNYIIYLVVYAVFLSLTGRPWIALIVGNTFFTLLGIVNFYVFKFRGIVLLPTDLLGAGTALDVLPNYTLFMNGRIYAAAMGWLILFLLAMRSAPMKLKGLKPRVATLAGAFVFAGGIAVMMEDDDAVEKYSITMDKWNQNGRTWENGLVVNLLFNLPDIFVSKPKGYDAKALAAEMTEGQAAGEDIVLPHIILILNESLADVSVLGDIGTEEDPLPFIHSLERNDEAYVGKLFVSVFGGNTSVSEFEVLTGFSLSLEYTLTSPYFTYVNGDTPSLPWYLKGLGYETYATHPMTAVNWNRAAAYPKLGMDTFTSLPEYGTRFGNYEMIRNYASDRTVYDMVISEYEQSGDVPFFMMAVTMQNHGGYEWRRIQSDFPLTGVRGNYEDVELYLHLLNQSDQAFEELITYWEQQSEPVLIVMFGDHWGALDSMYIDEIYDEEHVAGQGLHEELTSYVTPVVMWSNYGLDFSGVPDRFSTNYLATMLKVAAELPLTSFDSFLLELYEEFPIITIQGIVDEDGELHMADEYRSLSESLRQYIYLEYNAMFDAKNRLEDVFVVPAA